MDKKYRDFITSDKAQEIFGFQKTRVFKSMDITFIIIIMGKNEEYHMMFSMCSRWNVPDIKFFDQKFSDKTRMPYGKKWNTREEPDAGFIAVGEIFYTMEDYALFSCVNYLVHAIDEEAIFMLPVAGSTPILRRLTDITNIGGGLDKVPDYANFINHTLAEKGETT